MLQLPTSWSWLLGLDSVRLRKVTIFIPCFGREKLWKVVWLDIISKRKGEKKVPKVTRTRKSKKALRWAIAPESCPVGAPLPVQPSQVPMQALPTQVQDTAAPLPFADRIGSYDAHTFMWLPCVFKLLRELTPPQGNGTPVLRKRILT